MTRLSDEQAGILLPVVIPADDPGQTGGDAPWANVVGRMARAVGGALRTAAQGIGRIAVRAHGSVDPDARRDLAQMPLLALVSLAPRRAEVRALPDDGNRPVVFVHGLAGYRGNFLPMRSWFRLVGRSRTYAIGLRGKSLDAMADELRDYIARVVAVNELGSADQIDLVGHSMGGIVARLALGDPAFARRVATLVTLSSPHGGTQAARFAGTDICRELRPGSQVLRRLEAQLPWRGPIHLVCFWARTDPLMQPATTATVDGACNREVDGFSHLDWLLKLRAWQAIWRELEESRPNGQRRGNGRGLPVRSDGAPGAVAL